MHKRWVGVILGFVLIITTSAVAQVTGGGTAGTVPQFTGSSTVGNSPITVSGGNVGIGTTTPQAALNVIGTQVQVSDPNFGYTQANYSYIKTTATTLNTQTLTLGTTYGFNTPVDALSIFNGNVGIGTTNPYSALSVLSSGSAGYIEGQPNGFQILSGTNTGTDYTMYMGVDKAQHTSYIQSVLWGTAVASLSLNARGGNVGIGTTTPSAKMEVNGGIKLTSGSGGSIVFQDGTTQSTAYTGVLCGGDYAESMDVSDDRTAYAPGDVLVLDTDNPGKILKSIDPYSTAVAGIYSTKPGTVGRRQLTPKSDAEVPMAMIGVVPTKVSAENGAIKVGDLLVSSSRPGYAMKGSDRSRMLGAVIGKAMGVLDSGTGTIEVLVTLQ